MGRYFALENPAEYYSALINLPIHDNLEHILAFNKIKMESHDNITESDLIREVPPIIDFYKSENKLPKFIFKPGLWFPRGFLIDKVLLKNLGVFRMPEHRISKVKILYRKKWVDNFVYIYILENCIKYCDWNNSIFIRIKNRDNLPMKFNSLAELIEYKKENGPLETVQFKFTDSFPEFDIFGIFILNSDIYCSFNMKEKLDHFKISGLNFSTPEVNFTK